MMSHRQAIQRLFQLGLVLQTRCAAGGSSILQPGSGCTERLRPAARARSCPARSCPARDDTHRCASSARTDSGASRGAARMRHPARRPLPAVETHRWASGLTSSRRASSVTAKGCSSAACCFQANSRAQSLPTRTASAAQEVYGSRITQQVGNNGLRVSGPTDQTRANP